MKAYRGRSGHSAPQRAATGRERAAARRSERARAHLERVRGGHGSASVAVPKLALPIALALSLASGALFGSPIVAAARSWIAGEPIRIARLEIHGAQRLTLDEVGLATQIPRGARIDRIDPEEVETRLLAHPWIAEAAVVRLPASRLLIRIQERVPMAVARDAADGRWRVVEASGLRFADADERDVGSLPRLIERSERSDDERGATLAAAIELGWRFAAFGLPIPTEIAVDDDPSSDGWAVRLPGLEAQVVLGRDDLDARLAALSRLLEADPEELAGARQIDLRFAEQAVLRSAPASQGPTQEVSARGHAVTPEPRPPR